jgi:hypothetical protein
MRDMRTLGSQALCRKASIAALVLFAALIVALRPLIRNSRHPQRPFAFNRLAFITEPAADSEAPLTPPGRTAARLIPFLLIGTHLTIVKTRRTGFVPFSVHRLKLFSRTAADSPPAPD